MTIEANFDSENKKHAALFDLDGVLIDSEGLYTEFWSNIDRQYPTGIDNFAMVIKGNTLPNILDSYFANPQIQCDIIEQLRTFERTMQLPLFEGVVDYVKKLRSKGWSTAIVTSSNQQKMQTLFANNRQFAGLFDAVLTDADVTRSKPDPEGYLLAAKRLGCEPENCVVFEDSIAGLKAGRNSGAKVVAVATTNRKETISPLSDAVVETTADADLSLLATLW